MPLQVAAAPALVAVVYIITSLVQQARGGFLAVVAEHMLREVLPAQAGKVALAAAVAAAAHVITIWLIAVLAAVVL